MLGHSGPFCPDCGAEGLSDEWVEGGRRMVARQCPEPRCSSYWEYEVGC